MLAVGLLVALPLKAMLIGPTACADCPAVTVQILLADVVPLAGTTTGVNVTPGVVVVGVSVTVSPSAHTFILKATVVLDVPLEVGDATVAPA